MERKGFGPKALVATLVAGMILGGGGIYAWVHTDHGHEGGAPAGKAEPKKPTYVCPMHPTVVDDKPSNCPICGMKLVKTDVAEASSTTTEAVKGEAAAAAHDTYVCPMHPSVVSDKPGLCPICNMKLVKMEAAAPPSGEAGAQGEQEKTYVCPMHPTVVSHEAGNCPICGMKLVPATGSGKIATTVKEGERKIAFYRAPGDPKQMAHEPKKDDAGRDYVPVYEDELYGSAAAAGLATITIDPARQQLIGLKTARATESEVGGSWRTAGKVTVDETRIRQVNVKISGFVEEVYVDFVGKPVKKGEPLFAIYSPELVSAQNEYVLALRTQRALADGGLSESGDDLATSARRRLKFWDISEADLNRLEKSGEVKKTITLQSPISGVVTQKNVVQGARLNAGDIPYEITDLSKVWVLADIYESELRRVRAGMPATFTSRAYPAVEFKGQVLFIDPVVSPETRTVKVRLAFDNPEGRLKPELFGEVVLHAPEGRGLTIPADAVVNSGTQQVVFVSVGNGKFQPRPIQAGSQSGDRIEVVSGLIVGEEVVLRANFLVDSESRMKASLQAMQAAPGGNAAPAPAGSGSSHQGH